MVERLRVDVVLATSAWQRVVSLEVPAGCTLRNALERSHLLDGLDAAELASLTFGIHGRQMPPDTLLADGDQVEIYRPLPLDPKQRRRRGAAAAGVRDRSDR